MELGGDEGDGRLLGQTANGMNTISEQYGLLYYTVNLHVEDRQCMFEDTWLNDIMHVLSCTGLENDLLPASGLEMHELWDQ